jgi:hypothetical protein
VQIQGLIPRLLFDLNRWKLVLIVRLTLNRIGNIVHFAALTFHKRTRLQELIKARRTFPGTLVAKAACSGHTIPGNMEWHKAQAKA